MVQSLRAPAAPISSIDLYRSQAKSQNLQLLPDRMLPGAAQRTIPSHPSAPKRNRNRGVVLSQKGWQKLVQANVLHDQFGRRYTHEQLSERSLLDVRTISRLISCEVKVDKSTMRTFFRTFDLQLDADDYTTPAEAEIDHNAANRRVSNYDFLDSTTDITADLTSNAARIAPELLPLVEEVLHLKQHVIEECDRLLNRLGLDETTLKSLQESN